MSQREWNLLQTIDVGDCIGLFVLLQPSRSSRGGAVVPGNELDFSRMGRCGEFYNDLHINTIIIMMTSSNETFSASLALCAGNSPVPGEFPSQRPVTRSFDVFFDLCLNKRLSKQSWGWWFEMPSRSLWCHCNGHNNAHYIIFDHGHTISTIT